MKSSRDRRDARKILYRSVFASIRILGTMYSRSWAHNLSARMGLEVRGAMMNTPQQKDIPNV